MIRTIKEIHSKLMAKLGGLGRRKAAKKAAKKAKPRKTSRKRRKRK
jgi:hypothetical protein